VRYSAEAVVNLGIAQAEFLAQRSDQRSLHRVPQPIEPIHGQWWIDAFDTWLIRAPAEQARAAVRAALAQPSNHVSTLLDLPIADRRAEPPAPARRRCCGVACTYFKPFDGTHRR